MSVFPSINTVYETSDLKRLFLIFGLKDIIIIIIIIIIINVNVIIFCFCLLRLLSSSQ
jgi:hypothetical protein